MTARIRSRTVRIIGWLLTPVVVWAASFGGGWVAARTAGPAAGLGRLLVGSVSAGMVALVGWMVLMVLIGKDE